jgi:polar amino acid transport system substrate-binding protein
MTPRLPRRGLALAAAALVSVSLLGGCGSDDDGGTDAASPTTTGGSPTADACAKDQLQTKTAGKLTIATDKPAYPPWITDDDPTNGKGFESAVAYAVADELGYDKADVTWTRVKFDAAIQPGPKDFDFDINQFSISEDRAKVVDFSSPYYDVSQTVITTEDSPAADATLIADLGGLRLGAQVGTTSLDAINEVIKPDVDPKVYNSNDDAKLALQNGQVDAIVVDLPTAFFITSAELDNGKIVGSLPATGDQEQFGLLLDKGSPLTECVSQAVDALRDDGTLAELEDRWLAQAGAPVLVD